MAYLFFLSLFSCDVSWSLILVSHGVSITLILTLTLIPTLTLILTLALILTPFSVRLKNQSFGLLSDDPVFRFFFLPFVFVLWVPFFLFFFKNQTGKVEKGSYSF